MAFFCPSDPKMTPKTGPKGEKRPGYVIFSSKSTNEPIFIKIGVVDRNWPIIGIRHFLLHGLLSEQRRGRSASNHIRHLDHLVNNNSPQIFKRISLLFYVELDISVKCGWILAYNTAFYVPKIKNLGAL